MGYDTIKNIAVIWILDYELQNENKEYFTRTKTVEDKYCKYEIIKGVKYYFIELPKFRRIVTKKLETKLEEWLALIDYERKELIEMSINQNEKVKKAKEECEYLQGDEAAQRLEELRNRAIRDEKAAFSCGVKKGLIETAKQMIKNNIDINIIQKCTGLSLKEVKRL